MEFYAIKLVNKSRRITFECLEFKLPLHLDKRLFWTIKPWRRGQCALSKSP